MVWVDGGVLVPCVRVEAQTRGANFWLQEGWYASRDDTAVDANAPKLELTLLTGLGDHSCKPTHR